VRAIEQGEQLADLIAETKARAWVANAEHAVVRLITGERAMVRGGARGIEFLVGREEKQVFIIVGEKLVQVRRLYFHTHPRVTGPSADDLEFLDILGQTRSYLFEIGGGAMGTLIRRKGSQSHAN
jgi:hypothetical protein